MCSGQRQKPQQGRPAATAAADRKIRQKLGPFRNSKSLTDLVPTLALHGRVLLLIRESSQNFEYFLRHLELESERTFTREYAEMRRRRAPAP